MEVSAMEVVPWRVSDHTQVQQFRCQRYAREVEGQNPDEPVQREWLRTKNRVLWLIPARGTAIGGLSQLVDL
jgi:hypothetical protein